MDSGFVEEFCIEATELLDDIEEGLLDLEGGGEWQENYNKVYRAMHSLKGASGMMGMDVLQDHMHRIEDQFESLKTDQDRLKTHIDFFLNSVDHARGLLKGESAPFQYLDDIKGRESPEENAIEPSSGAEQKSVHDVEDNCAVTTDKELEKKYQLALETLENAYHLLIYQFVDLDVYLVQQKKEQVRSTLKREISSIAAKLEELKSSKNE